jgi:hypothetical protein
VGGYKQLSTSISNLEKAILAHEVWLQGENDGERLIITGKPLIGMGS